MNFTILQVYEDKSGRLCFRSDLPESLSGAEKASLMRKLRNALAGESRGGVGAAIRQLAFGAIMCRPDAEKAKNEFRKEVETAVEY